MAGAVGTVACWFCWDGLRGMREKGLVRLRWLGALGFGLGLFAWWPEAYTSRRHCGVEDTKPQLDHATYSYPHARRLGYLSPRSWT